MGYTAAEAHVHADELGDTFSDDMVERIEVKLGHPDRCPHGWPIDPDFEQAENRELEPLSALEPGARATIVRLAEHDGDLLHWFYDEGLVPGASVELRAPPSRRRASSSVASTAARRRSATSRRRASSRASAAQPGCFVRAPARELASATPRRRCARGRRRQRVGLVGALPR